MRKDKITFLFLSIIVAGVLVFGGAFLAQENRTEQEWLGNNQVIVLPVFPHRVQDADTLFNLSPDSIQVFLGSDNVTLKTRRISGSYQVALKTSSVTSAYKDKEFTMYFYKGQPHEIKFDLEILPENDTYRWQYSHPGLLGSKIPYVKRDVPQKLPLELTIPEDFTGKLRICQYDGAQTSGCVRAREYLISEQGIDLTKQDNDVTKYEIKIAGSLLLSQNIRFSLKDGSHQPQFYIFEGTMSVKDGKVMVTPRSSEGIPWYPKPASAWEGHVYVEPVWKANSADYHGRDKDFALKVEGLEGLNAGSVDLSNHLTFQFALGSATHRKAGSEYLVQFGGAGGALGNFDRKFTTSFFLINFNPDGNDLLTRYFAAKTYHGAVTVDDELVIWSPDKPHTGAFGKTDIAARVNGLQTICTTNCGGKNTLALQPKFSLEQPLYVAYEKNQQGTAIPGGPATNLQSRFKVTAPPSANLVTQSLLPVEDQPGRYTLKLIFGTELTASANGLQLEFYPDDPVPGQEPEEQRKSRKTVYEFDLNMQGSDEQTSFDFAFRHKSGLTASLGDISAPEGVQGLMVRGVQPPPASFACDTSGEHPFTRIDKFHGGIFSEWTEPQSDLYDRICAKPSLGAGVDLTVCFVAISARPSELDRNFVCRLMAAAAEAELEHLTLATYGPNHYSYTSGGAWKNHIQMWHLNKKKIITHLKEGGRTIVRFVNALKKQGVQDENTPYKVRGTENKLWKYIVSGQAPSAPNNEALFNIDRNIRCPAWYTWQTGNTNVKRGDIVYCGSGNGCGRNQCDTHLTHMSHISIGLKTEPYIEPEINVGPMAEPRFITFRPVRVIQSQASQQLQPITDFNLESNLQMSSMSQVRLTKSVENNVISLKFQFPERLQSQFEAHEFSVTLFANDPARTTFYKMVPRAQDHEAEFINVEGQKITSWTVNAQGTRYTQLPVNDNPVGDEKTVVLTIVGPDKKPLTREQMQGFALFNPVVTAENGQVSEKARQQVMRNCLYFTGWENDWPFYKWQGLHLMVRFHPHKGNDNITWNQKEKFHSLNNRGFKNKEYTFKPSGECGTGFEILSQKGKFVPENGRFRIAIDGGPPQLVVRPPVDFSQEKIKISLKVKDIIDDIENPAGLRFKLVNEAQGYEQEVTSVEGQDLEFTNVVMGKIEGEYRIHGYRLDLAIEPRHVYKLFDTNSETSLDLESHYTREAISNFTNSYVSTQGPKPILTTSRPVLLSKDSDNFTALISIRNETTNPTAPVSDLGNDCLQFKKSNEVVDAITYRSLQYGGKYLVLISKELYKDETGNLLPGVNDFKIAMADSANCNNLQLGRFGWPGDSIIHYSSKEDEIKELSKYDFTLQTSLDVVNGRPLFKSNIGDGSDDNHNQVLPVGNDQRVRLKLTLLNMLTGENICDGGIYGCNTLLREWRIKFIKTGEEKDITNLNEENSFLLQNGSTRNVIFLNLAKLHGLDERYTLAAQGRMHYVFPLLNGGVTTESANRQPVRLAAAIQFEAKNTMAANKEPKEIKIYAAKEYDTRVLKLSVLGRKETGGESKALPLEPRYERACQNLPESLKILNLDDLCSTIGTSQLPIKYDICLVDQQPDQSTRCSEQTGSTPRDYPKIQLDRHIIVGNQAVSVSISAEHTEKNKFEIRVNDSAKRLANEELPWLVFDTYFSQRQWNELLENAIPGSEAIDRLTELLQTLTSSEKYKQAKEKIQALEAAKRSSVRVRSNLQGSIATLDRQMTRFSIDTSNESVLTSDCSRNGAYYTRIRDRILPAGNSRELFIKEYSENLRAYELATLCSTFSGSSSLNPMCNYSYRAMSACSVAMKKVNDSLADEVWAEKIQNAKVGTILVDLKITAQQWANLTKGGPRILFLTTGGVLELSGGTDSRGRSIAATLKIRGIQSFDWVKEDIENLVALVSKQRSEKIKSLKESINSAEFEHRRFIRSYARLKRNDAGVLTLEGSNKIILDSLNSASISPPVLPEPGGLNPNIQQVVIDDQTSDFPAHCLRSLESPYVSGCSVPDGSKFFTTVTHTVNEDGAAKVISYDVTMWGGHGGANSLQRFELLEPENNVSGLNEGALFIGSGAQIGHCRHPSAYQCSAGQAVPGKCSVHGGRRHWGRDVAASFGLKVYAPLDGVVTYAGKAHNAQSSGGAGNYINIETTPQRGKPAFLLRFLHATGFSKNVYAGAKIKRGDLLMTVGSTGHSTGSHLHFEVYELNPEKNNVEPTDHFRIVP